jgi:hypothetical protein
MRRNSLVSKVTNFGLNGRVSDPGREFSLPLHVLSSGNGGTVFAELKRPEREDDHFQALRLRIRHALPSCPYTPS